MSKYLDDWVLGEVFVTPGRTIDASDVMLFAGLTGDYHENHTNAEYMKNSIFGRRIAHGLLGLSISHGLMMRLNLITDNSIALLGIEDWKFNKPIFFGDTVHVKITVHEIRFSRTKLDRGVLKLFFELINQHGEVCQSGIKVLMMKRDTTTGEEK